MTTTWAPRVFGIDPSLTGTGLCLIAGGGIELLSTVRTTGLTGHERLDVILFEVDRARRSGIDLFVIEGPSYGSQGGQKGHHERGGLWWLIAHDLYRRRLSYAVVAPRARAKYGTGNGGDGKPAVTAAVRERYGHLVTVVRNDNEADALLLAAMGADHMGAPLKVDVPDINRLALRKAAWPALPSDE